MAKSPTKMALSATCLTSPRLASQICVMQHQRRIHAHTKVKAGKGVMIQKHECRGQRLLGSFPPTCRVRQSPPLRVVVQGEVHECFSVQAMRDYWLPSYCG